MVQGKNDPRVPVTESEQMVQAIRQQGGAVWYLLAHDKGHGFAKKKNRDYQFFATILFLKQFPMCHDEARSRQNSVAQSCFMS